MKEWAPRQMRRLGFRHRPDYLEDQEAVKGMTSDQEVCIMEQIAVAVL